MIICVVEVIVRPAWPIEERNHTQRIRNGVEHAWVKGVTIVIDTIERCVDVPAESKIHGQARPYLNVILDVQPIVPLIILNQWAYVGYCIIHQAKWNEAMGSPPLPLFDVANPLKVKLPVGKL